MNLQVHPLAELFPMMTDEDLRDLAADIKAHGQCEPLVLLDGKIIDGRNRARACEIAGVEPLTINFGIAAGDVDPLKWIISKNLVRRHLTTSQRSMIAADLGKMQQGARTDLAQIQARSQPERAELLNVSRSSVQAADVVREDGVPELRDAVRNGEVTVSAAAEVAQLPVDEQKTITARGKVAESAAAIRREKRERVHGTKGAATAPRTDAPADMTDLQIAAAVLEAALPIFGVTRYDAIQTRLYRLGACVRFFGHDRLERVRAALLAADSGSLTVKKEKL